MNGVRPGRVLALVMVTLVALLARLLLLPVACRWRRDQRAYAVLGRDDGLFTDNAKYFFCWLAMQRNEKCDATFLSDRPEVVAALRAVGVNALRCSSPAAWLLLLRAGTLVLDGVDARPVRKALYAGARVIQIWHGIPLKEIELPLFNRRLQELSLPLRVVQRIQKFIIGRYPVYDILVCTSDAMKATVFSRCFRAHEIVATGYPRNDIFWSETPEHNSLIRINVDDAALNRIRSHQRKIGKVILYMPTFRGEGLEAPREWGLDLEALAAFGAEHQMLIVLKLHPLVGNALIDLPEGVLLLDSQSDAYPLLRFTDLLITDYSSVYFDYLLLNRPVVFFPFDYDSYVSSDRSLLFDYGAVTPGPCVMTNGHLLEALYEILVRGDDRWGDARKKLCECMFNDVNAKASQRLFDVLQRDELRSQK